MNMIERARRFCACNHIHNGSVYPLAGKFLTIRRETFEEAAKVCELFEASTGDAAQVIRSHAVRSHAALLKPEEKRIP
jgi:hypothetical protein